MQIRPLGIQFQTLTMFVGYQKFKTGFPGLFNSFHPEALVIAVFRQVIVSN
jgi:hypothetical protein